mmetsp:Transcript_129574/g.414436  ORF Transcript_129574/g.414436 Transcript_129574/m.414436 type:complete len:410 (-) Transcript_129574:287-1516(-)
MQASAYGCVVKIRCSKGLACRSLLAPWPPAASSAADGSAFEVPRLSPDASFSFILRVEPEAENEDDAYSRRYDASRKQLYAQLAVLHTNSLGERLLRVHNCMINVLPSVRVVYQQLNVEPLVCILVKQAAALALEQTDAATSKSLPRDCLLEFCLQTLASYTRHCQGSEIRPNMLVIGRQLQLLPLYILGARKLLYTATADTQDKAHGEDFLKRLLRMPVHSLLAAMYPRIYPLPARVEEGSTALPPAGRATTRILESGQAKAYLVASSLGTWFHYRGSSPCSSPRGDGSEGKDPTAKGKLQVVEEDVQARANPENTPETRASERVELWRSAEALTQRLRERLAPGPCWMPLRELPQLPEKSKTSLNLGVSWTDKILLSGLLVEDEGVTEMNYSDWVQFVHSQACHALG